MKIIISAPGAVLPVPTNEKAVAILLTQTTNADGSTSNTIVSDTPIAPGQTLTFDVAAGQMVTVSVYVDAP